MTPDEPLGLCLDAVVAVDDQAFYLHGWTRRRAAGITRLTAVTPEGGRLELLDRLVKYPRPDVDAMHADPLSTCDGFSCFVEVSMPGRQATQWLFELEDTAGNTLETPAPVGRDPDVARRVVLEDLINEVPGEDSLMRNHAFPALRLLAETQWCSPVIDRVIQFGASPVDPDVSIIVPLYGHTELVELQLATFADDPELAAADFIYVLDSPELGPELIEHCADLYEIYRLPFRIATLQRHSGYSGANNVGASLSRGRLLLLLNSDVVPRERGWLSTKARFYDATPAVGALGPKLVFEDDTIQHAGLCFEALPGKSTWLRAHYFKGMHRSLPAANQARAVPAVTGACLMISRELYLEHDGLLGLYVQGDYEDSDLCLRLRRAGHDNWYLPDVELYHLEGQSYDPDTRQRNARYNCWLHAQLRGDAIAEAMAEFSGAATVTEPG